MAFDANVRLGRLAGSRGHAFDTAEELLDVMDALGIARALVYAALARESDCARGNQLLQEKISGHPRLTPCWVGIPHRESPGRLVEQMNACKVPAMRVFPNTGHFSIRPWCLGPLARALADAKKALLLDFEGPAWTDDRIDWEGVRQLCVDCPHLPVVVCGITIASPSNYRGLLRECKNLHLEISQLACPGETRRLAGEGFADRLIFGSDLPSRHAGAPLTLVGLESLDEGSRRMILHDNLAGLLTPSGIAVESPQPRAIPRCSPIIDAHVHLGGWNHSFADTGRAEDALREMDRCGISAIIATSLWACFGEVALGNADIAAACSASPKRIHGYLTLDPKYPADARQQIKQYGQNTHFRGVKLHCQTHGVDISDSRCAGILAYANERQMPVLVHQTQISPRPWKDICQRYPHAHFIVAHVGGCGPDNGDALELVRLAAQTENLYFDIAATRNHFGFIEDLVAHAGAKKILFGSDYPLMDFGFELGQVLFSRINPQDKALILSGNARRIFQLSDNDLRLT